MSVAPDETFPALSKNVINQCRGNNKVYLPREADDNGFLSFEISRRLYLFTSLL